MDQPREIPFFGKQSLYCGLVPRPRESGTHRHGSGKEIEAIAAREQLSHKGREAERRRSSVNILCSIGSRKKGAKMGRRDGGTRRERKLMEMALTDMPIIGAKNSRKNTFPVSESRQGSE